MAGGTECIIEGNTDRTKNSDSYMWCPMTRRLILALAAAAVGIPVFAAPALKPKPPKATPLAGTTWVGNTAEGWEMTIEFVADGSMNVSYKQTKFNKASWTQKDDTIYWEMNEKYCEFNGKMTGNTIEGESFNVAGKKWTTKLTRVVPDR